ncbi:sugar ABC transporter substrate-binding protein [Microbacterium sp. NPDC078428]|uniref:sugar ABC transporter substrate-binding protein n=1 Tax=Microbacterium sp. NPDC078428 TaxID=3364190 RepID=UPI0037C99F48
MKHSTTRKALVAATAVLSLAAFTACSSSGGDAGGGSDDDTLRIGYSVHTLANPFFAGALQGLEEGAEEYGYELTVANADSVLDKQVSDISSMISQGIDYLFLTPLDGTAITPSIEAAQAAGIKVIVLADAVPAPVEGTLVSTPDEVGRQAGDAVVSYLTDKYGEPSGTVVEVTGVTGITAASGRTEGFMEILDEYPDIEVVAQQDGRFMSEPSYEVMSTILQAQPEIDAIFAANDASAAGVIAALKEAGRLQPIGDPEHIFIVGSDGSPPGIDAIRSGELDTTVSLNPLEMGRMAMDIVNQLEAGESPETEIALPVFMITPENIDSPEAAEFGIWAEQLDD